MQVRQCQPDGVLIDVEVRHLLMKYFKCFGIVVALVLLAFTVITLQSLFLHKYEPEDLRFSVSELEFLEARALNGDGEAMRKLSRFYLQIEGDPVKSKMWHDRGLSAGLEWASKEWSAYLELLEREGHAKKNSGKRIQN